MLNLDKLDAELRAACPRVVGCTSDGRVDFIDGTSWKPGDPTPDADRATVAALIAAHDPSDTPDQRLGRVRVPLRLLAALTEIASKGRAQAPPIGAPLWARAVVDNFAAQIDAVIAP